MLVRVDTSMADSLRPGLRLEARRGGHPPLQLEIERVDPHGAALLVAFVGIDSRSDAQSLGGATLWVERSELPPPDEGELYDFDLIGASVVSEQGEELGRIVEILVTGANDVYLARGPRGEIMIPATRRAVVELDVDRRTLVVDARALEYCDES